MSGQEDQDSWDSGPGSPSRASSPLGSREDLHESSERLGGGSYVCEETEEEEIMSEFRYVEPTCHVMMRAAQACAVNQSH